MTSIHAPKPQPSVTVATKVGLADDGFYRINEICTGGICNDLNNPGPWEEFLGKQAYRITLPILNPLTSAIWTKDAQGGWFLTSSKDPQLTNKLLFLNVSGATVEQMHDPKVYENLKIPETWCIKSDVVVPDKGIIPICQTSPLSRPRTNKQFPIISFSSLVTGIVIFLAMGFTVIHNLLGSNKFSFAAAMGEWK